MRPVEVVIQTILDEECLELLSGMRVGSELFVAVFVDAVRAFDSTVEMG